jgi:antitoxin FitA
MASLTIDNIEDGIISRLRSRADAHGLSLEEEAAAILKRTLEEENPGERLVRVFQEEFGFKGGIDLELPSRKSNWKPPTFD